MSVHVDGARIANAVAALGGTVAALRSLTVDAGVDVLSFGGTKNGLLGGEAVVYLNPELAALAPFVRKQVTQLASKMRFVAAQFNALLDDGLWIELATHANEMAALLHRRTADDRRGRARRGPPCQQPVPPTPTGRDRAVARVVLLLGLGRQQSPGALDDRLGHHRRRCRRVRGGCGEDPCNVQLTTELSTV